MTLPAKFTQSDVKRAVAGVTGAGLHIERIEIDANGKIIILTATGNPIRTGSSWDDDRCDFPVTSLDLRTGMGNGTTAIGGKATHRPTSNQSRGRQTSTSKSKR